MNDTTDYSSIEKSKDVQIVELQLEVANLTAERDTAIKLIIENGITGEHHGLMDYLRNMLQVYVSTRDNYKELKKQHDATVVQGLEVAEKKARSFTRAGWYGIPPNDTEFLQAERIANAIQAEIDKRTAKPDKEPT